MPACGIDPSIFVRLLTDLPAADYQATLTRFTAIRGSQPEPITVANFVIAEAYAVLQHHYGLSKTDTRDAMLAVLTSGLVEPLHGDAVLDALREAKEPGLTDRLIVLDYDRHQTTVLALDRKRAVLSGCDRR
ncbi:MAG: hypothetical protein Q8N18_11800 [Opitutaceae bacterium]|nr:hypothetical protein [Opitutaceae bacterium]